MIARVKKSDDGYSLYGLEPPGIERFPADVRKMFWIWVVELGLRAKDRDLAKGLDKDGTPFKPISPETKRRRRSAMTPSGKGDPNAPPLTPGWQKSRTRSLLTGRAFVDHAEFWWKYDAHTGDSWARILDYQADTGRDAFGLSPKALGRVKAQAWERWNRWRAGKYQEPSEQPATAPKPIRAGSYRTKYLDVMGHGEEIAKQQHAGFKTPEEWTAYFRETASARLPGRPLRPISKHPISGPRYNRGLIGDWNRPGQKPPPAPPPAPFGPRMPKPAPIGVRRAQPIRFQSLADIIDWIRRIAG